MIGLIGGVGSRASAGFVKKLISRNLTIPFMLYNNPLIQLVNVDPSIIIQQLAQSVQALVNGGCSRIAILCNTAHIYLKDLRALFPSVEFIDMIELTVSSIIERFDGEVDLTVGLVTTKGVIGSRLYHNVIERMSEKRMNVVLPVGLESLDGIHNCIYSIIGGRDTFSASPSADNVDCLSYIREQVAQMKSDHEEMRVVILGCTDIADLIPSTEGFLDIYNISSEQLLVVDPLEVLAQHVATWIE